MGRTEEALSTDLGRALAKEGYFLTTEELERVEAVAYAERDQLRLECDDREAERTKLRERIEVLEAIVADYRTLMAVALEVIRARIDTALDLLK